MENGPEVYGVKSGRKEREGLGLDRPALWTHWLLAKLICDQKAAVNQILKRVS